MKRQKTEDTNERTSRNTQQQQRQFLLRLFAVGIVVLIAIECFRPSNRQLLQNLISAAQEKAESSANLGEVANAKPIPDFDEAVMKNVEDNVLIRSEEAPAFRMLMSILQKDSLDELKSYSIGRVLFPQYTKQPEIYRGKLMTLKGVARRVVEEKVFDKSYGFDKIYQVWVAPEDCPSEPIVVYCLELPEGFPVGEDVSERVQFTAFFFKMWPYASQMGVRTTGLFYAKVPEWTRHSVPASEREGIKVPFSLVVLGALALAVLILLIINSRVKEETGNPEILPDEMDVPQNPESPTDAVDVVQPDEEVEEKKEE